MIGFLLSMVSIKLTFPPIIIATFLFLNSSYGYFMVEPHYNIFRGKIDDNKNENFFEGHTFGARIGYIGENLLMGVNVVSGNFNFQNEFYETKEDQFKGGGIGSFLGFHTQHIKIWVGYLNSTLEARQNAQGRYFGQYVSYGIGVNLFSNLYLNNEYFQNYYTSYEDDETGKTEGLDKNIKTIGNYFSLSILSYF